MLNFKQILVSLLAILIIAVFSTVTSKASDVPSNAEIRKDVVNVLIDLREDTIYYVNHNHNGVYFYQPSSEFEKFILVEWYEFSTNKGFKIDVQQVEFLDAFNARFTDSDLWELSSFEKVVN